MVLAFAIPGNVKNTQEKQATQTLSAEAINALQAKGFYLISMNHPVRSPRLVDSTDLPETSHIQMSLDLNVAKEIDVTWLGARETRTTNDTILTEGFEGDFPGNKWQLSGDPTWGKTNYLKHSGQNSVFCAKDGNDGVTPPANYPNNVNALMVFGPFDLTDASLAFVRFWYLMGTEINKDWFYYMASTDGVNFKGIGVSGTTEAKWKQTYLNLSDVPQLGELTGKPSVWIALGFTSDSTGTGFGVFVDDVEVLKSPVGTILSGYLNGTLSPAGNPYIAFDHIGVAQGDSLVILPGTEIRFDQRKEFVIQGLLLAQGTATDSIKFTSNNNSPIKGYWIGIGFYPTTSTGSLIQFARIEYGGARGQLAGGIYSERSLQIRNNLITSNGGAGVVCRRDIVVVDNDISNNETGVYTYFADPQIQGNIIQNNIKGIYLDVSAATIRGNKILNNTGAGIHCAAAVPKIIHNLIQGNGSDGIFSENSGIGTAGGKLVIAANEILDNRGHGISLKWFAIYGSVTQNLIEGNKNGINIEPDYYYGTQPRMQIYNNTIVANTEYGMNFGYGDLKDTPIINNIVAQNVKAGIYSMGENTSVSIFYNNLFGNTPNYQITNQPFLGCMATTNSNGDSVDIFQNMSIDPLFVNLSAGDFHLQYIENGFPKNSPCRDTGTPLSFFNDLDGSPNDIGAYGGAAIFINPSSFDFGKVVMNLDHKTSFAIVNDRDSSLVVSSARLSDPANFSLTQNFPDTINSYGESRLEVHLKATEVGKLKAFLILASSDLIGTDSCAIEIQGESLRGTIIDGGEVSGVWKAANSPYIITKNVVVPKGKTLNLEPGVEVQFTGESKFEILGSLNANGTIQDSVVFTRYSLNSQWHGLNFANSDQPSELRYCRIEHGGYSGKGGGIYCENSQITINNSLIKNCSAYYGGGIYCKNSSPIIQYTYFKDNSTEAGSIFCENSNPLIENCVIVGTQTYQGRTGITLINSTATIRNNIIANNSGTGIAIGYSTARSNIVNNIIHNNLRGHGVHCFSQGSAHIENNTITENGGSGLYFSSDADSSIVINNIIWENGFPEIGAYSGRVTVSYSNIKNGFAGIGNIDTNPSFIDLQNGDLHLQPNSPCIDAGNPNPVHNDIEDPNRSGFALAPAQGTIRNDIGVYGGPHAMGIFINRPPNVFSLLSPADKETLHTLSPTFQWEKAIDPNQGDQVVYTLQIDRLKNFAAPIIHANLNDTTYAITTELSPNFTYYWRVIASDSLGLQTFSKEVFRFTIAQITAVEETPPLPTYFDLAQNYPNPFNPETTFKYQLPKDAHVKLEIYNLLGSRVATLLDENKPAGYHQIKWNGRHDDGQPLSSGLYFAKIIVRYDVLNKGTNEAKVRKVILAK
jgi:parallel beta-helix repeat protein